MSDNTILRVLVWESLPPEGPGITGAEIIECVRAAGCAISVSSLPRVLLDLRELNAIKSSATIPRRFWRGFAAASAVARDPAGRLSWDDAKVAELHRLFALQPPLSQAEMGRLLGVSKNGIASKCKKERLSRRDQIPIIPIKPDATNAPRPTGREALPAGHPATWPVIAAHTPSIRQGWPG